jgi:glycosyltransferase involved in cell wall biosynthesis
MNFSPRQARLGWWIESKLSTRLYGRTMYVAVSQSTKRELCDLGVRPEMIEVIHNGSDVTPPAGVAKAPVPTVAFLGRLVPHKRVEMVLDAAATLSVDIPNVEVQIKDQATGAVRTVTSNAEGVFRANNGSQLGDDERVTSPSAFGERREAIVEKRLHHVVVRPPDPVQ